MAGSFGYIGQTTRPPIGLGTVVSGDIANGIIFSGQIAAGQIGDGHLASGSVISGRIASGQVGTNHLALASILSGTIASGIVGINHLASGNAVGQLNQFGDAQARLQFLDQTAGTSGALFTAPQTGLYRVGVYSFVNQGGLLNAGNLTVALGWTDDLQAQTVTPVTGVALVTSGAFGQSLSTLRVLSGTQVFVTTALGAVTGAPHYSTFAAAERLT